MAILRELPGELRIIILVETGQEGLEVPLLGRLTVEKKQLLSQRKIGEFLSMGVEMEGEEIGLYLASADVSASCAFKFDEWKKFVEGVNEANDQYGV